MPRAGREVVTPGAEPPATDGTEDCEVVPRDAVDGVADSLLGGETGRDPTGGALTGGVWTGGVWTVGIVSDGVLTDGVVMLGVLTCGVVTGPTVTEGAVTEGTVTDGTDTGTEIRGDEADGTLTEGGLPGAAAPEGAADTTSAADAARRARRERLMGRVATRVETLRRTRAGTGQTQTQPRSRWSPRHAT